jgi:hypothetical protein
VHAHTPARSHQHASPDKHTHARTNTRTHTRNVRAHAHTRTGTTATCRSRRWAATAGSASASPRTGRSRPSPSLSLACCPLTRARKDAGIRSDTLAPLPNPTVPLPHPFPPRATTRQNRGIAQDWNISPLPVPRARVLACDRKCVIEWVSACACVSACVPRHRSNWKVAPPLLPPALPLLPVPLHLTLFLIARFNCAPPAAPACRLWPTRSPAPPSLVRIRFRSETALANRSG